MKKQSRVEVKRAGGLTVGIHQQGRGVRGVSDDLHCIAGRFVATEYKRQGRPHPLSQNQKLFLQRVQATGGVGVVVESADDMRRIIAAITNGWPIVVAEDYSFTIQPPLDTQPDL